MPARTIQPRGWHYYQEGYDKPITGHSYPNLLDEIAKFRVANSLPFGNPEEDHKTYLLRRFPHFRLHGLMDKEALEKIEPVVEKGQQRTGLDEIRLWNKYVTYYASTGRYKDLVQKEEAEKRAVVCQNCHKNRPFAELTHCAPCLPELQRQSTMFTQGKTANKNLGYCAAAWHDLRTAVWLPKEGLERSLNRVDQTVEECWLRKYETQA